MALFYIFFMKTEKLEKGTVVELNGKTVRLMHSLVVEEVKKPDNRHKYEPNKKYPWFCKHCGYAEHEKIMHL